jgi:hypothetical protein
MMFCDAAARRRARRCACNLSQNGSKPAAQSIGRVSGSEPHRIDGFEMEADTEKLELHAPRV